MSITLDEYIATRYGVYQGAQKDFLKDNAHMTNPEVSRWCTTNWRVDLTTGSLFKESKKKVNLIEPKFDVISHGESIRFDYSDKVFFVSESDAKSNVNGVLIKAVVKDGFLTVNVNSVNSTNAPIFFNDKLWNQGGIQLSISDDFVFTEIN